MAVEITSGDLKYKVLFKQPVSSLNDEGGKEFSFSPPASTIEKNAAVRNASNNRATEARATALSEALDIFVRYSASMDVVTKDSLITYNSEDYVIHQIEHVDQRKEWIRYTAKVRTDE